MRKVKLENQVPPAYPIGLTKIRCECGREIEVDAQEGLKDGIKCECGFEIPGRGNIPKNAGDSIMRRYASGRNR